MFVSVCKSTANVPPPHLSANNHTHIHTLLMTKSKNGNKGVKLIFAVARSSNNNRDIGSSEKCNKQKRWEAYSLKLQYLIYIFTHTHKIALFSPTAKGFHIVPNEYAPLVCDFFHSQQAFIDDKFNRSFNH